MKMILGANANSLGSHVGEWHHTTAWVSPCNNLQNAIRLAQIAEAGKSTCSPSRIAPASAMIRTGSSSSPPTWRARPSANR